MSLITTAAHLAVATPVTGDVVAQSTEVTTTGVRAWIGDNIVFLIMLLIACAVLIGGLRANLSRVVTVGGLALIGIAYFALSSNKDASLGVGNWLLSLFGINVA
ncbi:MULTISPECIES: hypothetical protein [unclassified Rhodococcus (in: high G+C Gram-positive bacteria)]|uniref:hypothetical protein n=1 Tax=unclassified Rhodococcus (in: high G+C Gram-positive bacteria) TaxID=192944 RepID=UPI0018CFB07B|nr:hypothetical protein [Rhodococcus sp. CX]MBH0119238.1 hypothetical protein [Rhodococcus sp. CX]